MARKKKEDKVIEEETLNETVEETIEEQMKKAVENLKDDVEETINNTEDLVPTIASTKTGDNLTVDLTITTGTLSAAEITKQGEPQSIERKTPFGTEVWDPITKRTILIDG